MICRVRKGYVVHDGRQMIQPGEVFEPSPEILAGQGHKLEPIKEVSLRLKDGAWRGRRCFILGGGPSLADWDFSRLQGELVIGINRAFELFDPTIIFGIDSRLYKWLCDGSLGSGPTQRFKDSQALKVWVESHSYDFGNEVEKVPRLFGREVSNSIAQGIFSGSHSGFAALNLAICLGANPIYLIGFDLQTSGQWQKNFHDGYPVRQRDEIYNNFREEFEEAAPILKGKGIRVINLNPDSGLKCFEFGMIPEPREDKVTVITPTGDRPEALALLRRWVSRQIRQPDQWLIVDDGQVPVDAARFPGATVIRREPQADDPPCTLGKNLAAALALVAHDKVIVMEDDDWYGPEYIETLAGLLDVHELAGIWGTKCYHPGVPGWKDMGREDHASLSQTGFRKSLIPDVFEAIPGDGKLPDCSVDLRLWWNHNQGRGFLLPGADRRLHCAIKGLPGRAGAGCAHERRLFQVDSDLKKFREWCDDPDIYLNIISRNRTVIYTAIAGAGRDTLVDPVPIPGVDYVCFTDQPLESKVWEIRPFTWSHQEAVRTAKHPKALPHTYFPDHDISIWVDANITPGPQVAKAAVQSLNGHGLAMHRHPRRNCPYEEAQLVIQEQKDHQDLIQKTIHRCEKAGLPAKSGLYECGILFRRHHDPAVKAAMEMWWQEICAGTSSDQISYAYSLWKTGLQAMVIEMNLRENPNFEFRTHAEIYWGKQCA